MLTCNQHMKVGTSGNSSYGSSDFQTNRLSQLSMRALELGATIPTFDNRKLARWLYRYGCLPYLPSSELDYKSDDNPMTVLALSSGCTTHQILKTAYEATTHADWVFFSLASAPIPKEAACKLYVSPQPVALAEAFPVVAKTFTDQGVRSFKVGRGIEGLFRSDKIIAYFDNLDDLIEVTKELVEKLAGCPAQGVPFTAEHGLDGLLSWSIDPPVITEPVSWRSWITLGLATELVKVQTLPINEAVEVALDAVSARGVNTDLWIMERATFSN